MKRDFAKLESRRLKAAEMLGQGLSQAEVARKLEVSRESVRRWQDQINAGGQQGLKKAGRAGRKPRLQAADCKQLEAILKEGPEKSGYPTGLWTLERIAAVIHERFGVDYHVGHVWRILRGKLGWSCQRPIGRARERKETAIRDWKQTIWPALKKKPKKKAGPSSSSTKAD
jgi:transposase